MDYLFVLPDCATVDSRSPKVTVVPITSTIRDLPVVVIVQPDRQNGLRVPGLVRVPDVSVFDKMR